MYFKKEDVRTIKAINLTTPLLPCITCGKENNTEQRIDTINLHDIFESFCLLPCYKRLMGGDST